MENLQPPTDNLYKFVAIGGLAVVIVCLYIGFREQGAQREKWIDAQVQLLAGGYQEGTGMPADPALRQAYARREFAHNESNDLIKLFTGTAGHLMSGSLAVSIFAFGFWWWKVQRHEDAILRVTAAKLQHDVKGDPAGL